MEGVTLASLPVDVLRLTLSRLELKDRVRLLCCSKSLLWRLREQLLDLRHVEASLTSLHQARSFASWLASGGRKEALCCLALTLPPLQDAPQYTALDIDLFRSAQSAGWGVVWDALPGAERLEALSWDAMGGASGGCTAGSPHAGDPVVTFDHEPLPGRLPSLHRLSISSPAISLSVRYSSLAALTQLQLAGYCISLAPGCLPRSLRSLTVDWRRGSHQGCRHLWEIWMAAAGAAALGALRLLWCRDQSVNFHGLERMTNLTSLKLERGFLRGLPPQVTALRALKELELCEMKVDRAAWPAGSGELAPLSALTRLQRLRVASVDYLEASPEVTAGIWQLPALQEVALHGLRWRLRNARWPSGIMSAAWAGGIPAPALELDKSHSLSKLTVDLEAALDNLPGIAAMRRLEELTLLHSAHMWRLSQGTVPQLAQVLRGLPKLRRLEVRPASGASSLATSSGGGSSQQAAVSKGPLGELDLLAGTLAAPKVL